MIGMHNAQGRTIEAMEKSVHATVVDWHGTERNLYGKPGNEDCTLEQVVEYAATYLARSADIRNTAMLVCVYIGNVKVATYSWQKRKVVTR